MTGEELIAEGRQLQRPSWFLRPEPLGEVAAIWHDCNEDEIESTGHHCWITIDARFVPGLPSSTIKFLRVLTNEDDCEGGKIEVSAENNRREGIKLYAHPANVIPPLDAVMLKGSDAVGQWLAAHKWQRDWGYNGNFQDEAAKAYNRVWFAEHPMYRESDIFAILGGWHFQFPDSDWMNQLEDQHVILTLRDSEPWVEGWLTRNRDFKVFQRIT